MDRLTEIANKNQCDKGTEWYEKHSYTPIYANYIPEKGEFTLLEIGVWHGDSLRTWNEYNPNMNIIGIDIDVNVLDYITPSGNIKIMIGDQANKSFITTICKQASPRFIIDDGSHREDDIFKTFIYTYDLLEEGGVYFIEDLHAPSANREGVIYRLNAWLDNTGRMYKKMSVIGGKLLIIEK